MQHTDNPSSTTIGAVLGFTYGFIQHILDTSIDIAIAFLLGLCGAAGGFVWKEYLGPWVKNKLKKWQS